jgi:hypothetical protein
MSETFDLIEDDRGRLTLKRPGQDDVVDIRIRRAFPWTQPSKYVSIRSSEGKELLLISDLSALPAALREAIERWLAATSFIPRILQVNRVNTSFGFQEWTVETDRGPASFRVQEREDIRFLGGGRFRIKDADGNIYELPSLTGLSKESQKELESVF